MNRLKDKLLHPLIVANADRIIDLLHEAKARPAGAEREQFLAQACQGDPALREQIVSLLQVDAEGESDFLKLTRIIRPDITPTEKPGDRIGRYKLLEQIGEGGCGVVYVAEQTEPVRRRVALKLVKLGMDTKQVVARFEAERQALAMMDHPNIAKVHDGGATDTGRPFFVMELVRGIKITDYCDQNNLSTGERLELFIQVCQAIQHAHQKGIIHRDIKPSNVLVSMHDEVPVPKVIDFGIAKAISNQPLTDKTVYTAFEQFIGTPAYMSPEQAKLSGLDIDTRTDVYSLGVLLYELLTGQTPFDAKELLKAGLDEMRQIIREQEAPKPSTRLSTMQGEDLTTTARHRNTEPPKLIHQVRGDLDWIVMRCLEKDRSRRYETANGLATDIQRHLNNEPVLARPPSRLYEFQKTVRRHKFGFAAAAALILVLAAGVVVSALEAIRAARAESEQIRRRLEAQASQRKSQTEAAKATAISDFLQQMLRSANPDDRKGSDYTVRQMLDDFSAGLTNQFAGQPEVEASLRYTIGRAYFRLAATEKAVMHLERALALCRSQLRELDEQVAETLVACAWAYSEQGQAATGEVRAREALEIYRKRGTRGRPVVAAVMALQRILIQEERFAEAEELAGKALVIAHEPLDAEFPELATLLHALSEIRVRQNRYAEAESLASKAVEMHRRLRGAEDVETGWALLQLGRTLKIQNKLAEAETAFREALTIFRKQYPYRHHSIADARGDLRALLKDRGDSAGLAALNRDQFADADQSIRRDDTDPEAWVQRGLIEADLNEWKAANQDNERAIALCKDQSREKRKAVGEACVWFVDRAARAGQSEIAEGVAGETVALFKRLASEQPEDSQAPLKVAAALHSFSFVLRQEGKLPEAEATAREALAIRRKLLGNEHVDVAETIHLLAWNLNMQGKHAEAEALSGEEVAMWRKLLGNDHPNVAWALGDLTIFLRDQGKLAEAETALRQSLAIRQGDSQALNELAWHLATDPDAKQRDGSNAVAYAQRAVAATTRTNALFLDTLAAACAESGAFEDAVRVQREAIALLRDDNQKKEYFSRLMLYESRTPYRDDYALASLTSSLLASGKFVQAESIARDCLAQRQKQIPDDWRAFNARTMLGYALLGQKRFAEAEPLLLAGYEGMNQRRPSIPAEGATRPREALQRLVELYEQTSRPAQVAEYKKKLAELEKTEK